MLWMLIASLLFTAKTALADAEPSMSGKVDVLIEEALPEARIHRGKIILTNGFTFEVVDETSHELRHHLNELSREDLETFKKKRIERLVWLAKYLSYGKLSSGFGYIENEKLSMVKDGVMGTHPIDEISAVENSLTEKEQSSLSKEEQTARRYKVIEKILKYYDNKSFENSKNFVGGKEYCFDLLLAPMSVVGVGTRMFGGSFGINIIIGFDTQTRRISFQVKRVFERANVGMAFMPLGLNARVGLFSRSTTYAPKSYNVAYTPALPMYKFSGNGIKGGGISMPITLLGILTGGAFTAAENFMTYAGPNHTVTLIDTGFTLKFPNISGFFQSLKQMVFYGSRHRCAGAFD